MFNFFKKQEDTAKNNKKEIPKKEDNDLPFDNDNKYIKATKSIEKETELPWGDVSVPNSENIEEPNDIESNDEIKSEDFVYVYFGARSKQEYIDKFPDTVAGEEQKNAEIADKFLDDLEYIVNTDPNWEKKFENSYDQDIELFNKLHFIQGLKYITGDPGRYLDIYNKEDYPEFRRLINKNKNLLNEGLLKWDKIVGNNP
jgi:hypothetical protein